MFCSAWAREDPEAQVRITITAIYQTADYREPQTFVHQEIVTPDGTTFDQQLYTRELAALIATWRLRAIDAAEGRDDG